MKIEGPGTNQYVKKPTEWDRVTALKWTGDNYSLITKTFGKHVVYLDESAREDSTLTVFDIERKRWLDVSRGFYILKSTEGSVRVLSPEDFEDDYQKVNTDHLHISGTVHPLDTRIVTTNG